MAPARVLQTHAETLYVQDESGDMVSVNEPWGPGQRRAPRAIFLTTLRVSFWVLSP